MHQVGEKRGNSVLSYLFECAKRAKIPDKIHFGTFVIIASLFLNIYHFWGVKKLTIFGLPTTHCGREEKLQDIGFELCLFVSVSSRSAKRSSLFSKFSFLFMSHHFLL